MKRTPGKTKLQVCRSRGKALVGEGYFFPMILNLSQQQIYQQKLLITVGGYLNVL